MVLQGLVSDRADEVTILSKSADPGRRGKFRVELRTFCSSKLTVYLLNDKQRKLKVFFRLAKGHPPRVIWLQVI